MALPRSWRSSRRDDHGILGNIAEIQQLEFAAQFTVCRASEHVGPPLASKFHDIASRDRVHGRTNLFRIGQAHGSPVVPVPIGGLRLGHLVSLWQAESGPGRRRHSQRRQPEHPSPANQTQSLPSVLSMAMSVAVT